MRPHVFDGTVTSVVPFGAFVEVAEGVNGLLADTVWLGRPESGSLATKCETSRWSRVLGVSPGEDAAVVCAAGGEDGLGWRSCS